MSTEVDDLLSSELETCIENHDSAAARDLDSKGDLHEIDLSMLRKIILVATSSFEGFSNDIARKLVTALKANPDTWVWAVDDHYSREAVGNIRGTVRRFLKLTHIPVGIIPSKEINTYLREATRCYVYGFPQASIALSRAALESGLNELLKRRVGAVPKLDLVEKINKAEEYKLIGRSHAGKAHDVRKAAGMVLHQKPASASLSFDTLSRTRDVLLALYAK